MRRALTEPALWGALFTALVLVGLWVAAFGWLAPLMGLGLLALGLLIDRLDAGGRRYPRGPR